MGSLAAIPPLVSPRTEGDMNEHPPAIGDRTNNGGGGPSPHDPPLGPAERHVDIEFLTLRPLLRCLLVPRVHPPTTIEREGMTYCS